MGESVSTVVRCGCGYLLWGEEIKQQLTEAEQHIRNEHPELVGTLSPLELAQPPAQGAAQAAA